MRTIHWLREQLKGVHPLSVLSFRLGVGLMLCCYITAAFAYFFAPLARNYFYAMSVFRGGIEAAPACFAAGICAGLIGDLMLRQSSGRGE